MKDEERSIIKRDDARERALAEAEKVFSRKGFAATKLRDVASELGLSHAALYYLIRMAETDLPALPEEVGRRLMVLLFEEMIVRLRTVLRASAAAGEIAASTDAGLVAGAFIGLVESLRSVPRFAVSRSRWDMANDLIEILLKGLDYQEGES